MAKDSLTDLLSQLNVQSSHNEHSQVEETSIKLLDNGCSNPNIVLKHCLVALIQQDKYNKALTILSKYSKIDEKYGNQFRLEKLYIFYKLNNTSKFETLYASIISDDLDTLFSRSQEQLDSLRGILHVRAQFCYKNGKYTESYRIYNYLASNNNSELDNTAELASNERVPLTVVPDLMIEYSIVSQVSDDSFDILFNESIVLAAQGKYEESIQLLERAHDMATTDSYQDDINAIELQLAYVNQLIGNNQRSKELLTSLLEKLAPGTPMYLIAENNIKALLDFSKYNDNINLILRELNVEKLNSLNLQHFTHEQWNKLVNNTLFLKLFNAIQLPSGSTILSRTLCNYTKIIDNVTLEPYETQAKKLYHFAVKSIKSGIEGSIIGLILLTVQLLVIEKQWDNAIRLCEAFINKSLSDMFKLQEHEITIIYVLLELYNQTGRTHSKNILLKKLETRFNINHLLNSKESIMNILQFWKHIAFQYLTVNKSSEAKKLFKQLMKVEYFRSNLADENVSQIIQENNSGLFDISRASELVSSVDVESLISAGVRPLENASTKSLNSVGLISKITKKRLEAKKQKTKEAKLKKFLATHDVANKTADPERWLPLRDRSSYKPKKKQLAKQTQGGAMNKKSEQALDMSKNSTKNTSGGKKKSNKKGRK